MQPPRNDTETLAPDPARPVLIQESLSRQLVGAFFAVHRALGFGFLEGVYANALTNELRERGIRVEREVPVQVHYSGRVVGQYRADLLIERTIVAELKATRLIGPTDRQQLLNYLRATELELGFLLHFGPTANFKRLIHTNDRKPALLPR